MFRILDSTYKYLITQAKLADTISLCQEFYDKHEFRELTNFDKHIENGTCAITDNDSNLQYHIIRQKGSWYRGAFNAWGGRRYFLPGRKEFFLEATDWIS